MASRRSLGTLTLDLIAKTGAYTQGLDRAGRETAKWRDRVNRSTKKAERDFVNLSKSSIKQLNATGDAFKRMAGLLTTAFSIQQVAGYADSYISLQNRIKSVDGDTGKLADTTNRLFKISNEALTPINTTARLYQKLALGTKNFARSQEDLYRVIQTVAKAGSLANDGVESYSAALIQFGQAFGGDFKTSSQELNSVLEQTPYIAKAIADGLGIPIVQLKQLAKQSKLSGKEVFEALLKVSDQIDQTFTTITKTTTQSLGVLKNSVTQYVGEMNTAYGGSVLFNKGIITLSENINTLAKATSFLALVFAGRLVGSLVASRKASLLHALAMVTERAEIVGLSAATGVYTARLTFATIATNLFTLSLTAVKAALGVLGGPIGLLVIVAGALYMFSRKADEAAVKAQNLAEKYDAVANKLNKVRLALVNKDIADAQAAVNKTLEKQADNLSFIGLITGSSARNERKIFLEKTKREAHLNDLLNKRRKIYEDIDRQSPTKEQPFPTVPDKVTQKALDKLQKINDELVQQGKTLGFNSAAVIRYRLTFGDLSQAVKDAGKAGRDLAKSIILNQQILDSKKLTASINNEVKALSMKRMALGETDKEIAINNALQQAGLNIIGDLTPAQEKLKATVIDQASALYDATAAQKEFDKNKEKSAGILQALKTPYDEYIAQVKEINKLESLGTLKGGLSSTDAEKARLASLKKLKDATKETADEMTVFMEQAAKRIQDVFANNLFDFMQGQFKFTVDSFKQMIDRMVAEALAADITGALFGNSKSKSKTAGLVGKGVNSLASVFTSNTSSSGNYTGGFGPSSSSGIGDFFGKVANLFSFAGGGFTGIGSRSGGIDGYGGFPAILHPNETVIDHSKGQNSGGNTVQVFVNGIKDTPELRQTADQIALKASMALSRAGSRNG